MTFVDEPVNNLRQSSSIFNIELCSIFFFRLLFNVTANAGTAASGNLGNAQVQCSCTHFLRFTSRHDDSSVRNCDSQDRDDSLEDVIRHTVVECVRVDIISRTDTRHGNCVRSAAESVFQMLGVHQDADKVVLVVFQSVQHSAANVVDARFHSTVHRFSVISIIALWSSRMQRFVCFLVISFLEQDVSADSCIFQLLVVFNCCCSNVYVNTTDCAVLVFDAVDCIDAFQDVLDRVHCWMLARFQRQTFVTHVLQSSNFLNNLFLSQFLSLDCFVLSVVRAVNAAVYAVVGQVQRREHYDSVAVEFFFDFVSQLEDFFVNLRVVTFQQQHCFLISETFAILGSCQQSTDSFQVVFVFFRPRQGAFYLCVINEFCCDFRFAVIHFLLPFYTGILPRARICSSNNFLSFSISVLPSSTG